MAKAARLESTRDSIFESRDLLAFFQRRRADGSLIPACGKAAFDWATDQKQQCCQARENRPQQPEALGGLIGQATKGSRWIPWHTEAMKDVFTCDKSRGAGKTL
jgi:hypothetical protein